MVDHMAALVPIIISSLMSGLVGWAVGSLKEATKSRRERSREHAEMVVKRDRDAKEERDRTRSILRLLLGYRLADLHRRYVVNGNPITLAEKHEAEDVYRAYHELGGNGSGTQMFKEIIAVHLQKGDGE